MTQGTDHVMDQTTADFGQLTNGWFYVDSVDVATQSRVQGTVVFYWSPEKEHTRDVVNQWIRTSGAFDGVIDFAKATADPSDPEMYYPPDDSGDRLHPGDAGYQAMANAVDLGMLLHPVP